MIALRPCKLTDTPQLLPLLEQLGYPTTDHELTERLANYMSQEGYGVAVACDKDKVVGLIAWSRSYFFVNSKIQFHVDALVVDKSYRGQGIGQKLMRYLESIAHQSKPAIIELTSGLRRAKDGTHDFYKNLGYHNEGPMAKLYLRKEIS